jgi:hypothetical protein
MKLTLTNSLLAWFEKLEWRTPASEARAVNALIEKTITEILFGPLGD